MPRWTRQQLEAARLEMSAEAYEFVDLEDIARMFAAAEAAAQEKVTATLAQPGDELVISSGQVSVVDEDCENRDEKEDGWMTIKLDGWYSADKLRQIANRVEETKRWYDKEIK